MAFVHLHTHSHYSLLDGLAKIDELVAHTKELGMDALALTDHGNLYGAIEFYKKAKKEGIHPILGVEAYIAPKSRFEKKNHTTKAYHHITLLAQNTVGWQHIIQLVTKAHLEGFYYKPRIDTELLLEHHEGIIVLSGCMSGYIPHLLLHNQKEEAYAYARTLKHVFGDRFYIEVWKQEQIPETKKVYPLLVELAREEQIPLVATQDIHYLRKEDAFYHEILLAVQTGNNVEDSDRMSLRAGDFSMRSPEEMKDLFSDIPEAIENTEHIAKRCQVDIDLNTIHLPSFPIPENLTSFQYLTNLVSQRAPQRYTTITQEIKDRISYELSVIEKTGYADYFLIVQDFVNWAKERKIVVGPGRGSAAGSIVSYILNITDIDPIKYNLLFERFLNPDRIQMPDIDIDFTDIRRDEVMGYLREKYGENSVAHIITFGTMASRAAIRDVGRALGLSYTFCDRIAKMIPFNFTLQKALAEVSEFKKEYDTNSDAHKLIDAAQHLEGVVRHASVHACGIVISKGPLTQYLPLQFAPQDPSTIITQFEMNTVESLGLLKMDLLGLKNLTIIEKTIKLIREQEGIEIIPSSLPLDDAPTYETFQKGLTTGVFQFESSGMRRYLRQLLPTEFEDIVAMVALYRPGPMELIPSYIARKHGREAVSYLHPQLEPILSPTYGIGIYQEQMMRIARDLAGFSLSEADTLRKAIGKKIKELLDQQKEKLIAGMIARGIDSHTAQKIWDLFPPFARYGFNRSHAVSYASIAYQTAYLKTHYPIAFMTSLCNADKNDIDRISFLVSEARKVHIPILPPDINKSFHDFTPEDDGIRFGLSAIKNVGSAIVEAIVEERERAGAFRSLSDFLSRVLHKDVNKKSLESLIKAGVFDCFGIDRNVLLENLDKILGFSQHAKKHTTNGHHDLFGPSFSSDKALSLKEAPFASTEQKLFWEKELIGFYISDHPLTAYTTLFKKKKVTPLSQIVQRRISPHTPIRIGGIVTSVKRILTKQKKHIAFVKVEDTKDIIEVIVFSDVLERRPEAWEENSIVIIQGKLSERDEEPKIVCDQVLKLN